MSSGRVSIVLVHYHRPELAAAAVAAVHRDLAASQLAGEVLLVDNGSTPAGRAALAALPAELIEPGENLGYAGGVNLGVSRAGGEVIVVMNPDVLVVPGCLGALVGALRDGADVAGPCFFWDRERRFLLPPSELRTRRAELLALLAARSEGVARLARRRFRRHARRHWRARTPLSSEALSGSLLTFRRESWSRVGAFDPDYPLFFEETDWLRRARRVGLRTVYVAQAQAVHLFGQSTAREVRAASWFQQSERRFRDRHYGSWFRVLLEGLAAHWPAPSRALGQEEDFLDLSAFTPPFSVEVSPNRTGVPAAAACLREAPSARFALPPDDDGARNGKGTWHCRVVNASGREVAVALLRRPSAGA